jgi:hypothetical protein
MTASKAWIAAIYSSVGSGLSALAIVLVGNTTLADLTQAQWLGIGIAVVTNFGASFGLVYHTSNKPAVVEAPVVTGVEV